MAKFIFADLLFRNENHTVVLEAETLKSEAVNQLRTHAIDLSSTKNQQIHSSQKAPAITDIHSEKPKDQKYFLHIDSIKAPFKSRKLDIFRMVALGLLILFGINIINIYEQGLNLKNNFIASAAEGYEGLLKAGDSASKSDFLGAELEFSEAQNSFAAASKLVNFLQNTNENPLYEEKNTGNLKHLLQAAQAISSAGQLSASTLSDFQDLPKLFIQENKNILTTKNAAPKSSLSLTEKLKKDLEGTAMALMQLEIAQKELDQVDLSKLPLAYRDKISSLNSRLGVLLKFLHHAQSKLPIILKLLGDRYQHRYLILLQNDTESRPTGGFIGSFMLVDINDGIITKADFHDVYDFDGQLHENIPAPADIAKITKNWRLRDSNYSPDYEISAEKAAWFLQKEKGPSVDSVIAINQSFIADLLGTMGGVEVKSLKKPLTKENFQLILSYIIESKLSATSPKKVLGEFIQAFQTKLLSTGDWSQIFIKLIQGLSQKNILLYSRDTEIQNFFIELGFAGKQRQINEKEDYLQVTATSIGGNKSDAFIKQTLAQNTYIAPQGKVTDELLITRKHLLSAADIQKWGKTMNSFGFQEIPEYIKDILGRGENRAQVKVYVPKGAKLISVTGIDTNLIETVEDAELNKTYFTFEMRAFPGNESEVLLRYELPKSLNFYPADTYKFYAQKQPGLVTSKFTKKVIPEAGLKMLRRYPEKAWKDDGSGISYEADLTSDLYLSALVSN